MSLSSLRRWLLEAQREKNWQTASKQCKQKTPYCRMCLATTELEAHDKYPYHLIPPDDRRRMTVEAWELNMVTLNRSCHRGRAHCNDPQCLQYNPKIMKQIEALDALASWCTR